MQCQLCLAYIEDIKKTNEQIKALKKWIKYNTDVDIEMDGLVEEMDGLFPDEPALTSKEMKEWEQHISSIEERSKRLNYGRKERMAESL